MKIFYEKIVIILGRSADETNKHLPIPSSERPVIFGFDRHANYRTANQKYW
jgi:hypothetical protein